MRRFLLLCLGIAAITWLEFRFFPGHTYLQSDTQIYLPILERIDTPNYLSRDPIATHPHVSYTIYDEVAVFLHHAGNWDFKRVLIAQQVVFRAAEILGVFLIAEAAGFGVLYSLVLAALINLGATLLGPAALLVGYEPIPRAFAFGLTILAVGLFVRDKPLLAGLAAGLGFLYQAAATGPFWALLILMAIFDHRARSRVKPALVTLLVAILLLANMAQLQPDVVESQHLFGRISPELAAIQLLRTRYVWVSTWAAAAIWNYLFIWVCGIWATARIWPRLNRPLRWFFIGMPLIGLAGVPCAYLLLERMRLMFASEEQPARALLLTVLFASLACGMAGIAAASRRRLVEAWLWFFPVMVLPMKVRILDLAHLPNISNLRILLVAVGLSGVLALLFARSSRREVKLAALLVPLCAIFAMPFLGGVQNYPYIDKGPITQVADWARRNTWGSSMFLFPDAGHALYPGIFRAESRRALWVDWMGGTQANFFESVGVEWLVRWRQAMEGAFSVVRLDALLPLPIDYYVLKREHRLPSVKPVYENPEFVVYDAQDLRNASTSLRLGTDN
ncbi:MAG TPA: hypothetical protein VHZ07_08075 [Bryobacteraceae bacterium]|jgi:hypothetical protein|nr:hypothetical protein [Bryobacteraceae bacterium]